MTYTHHDMDGNSVVDKPKRIFKGRVNISNATLQELCRRVTELELEVKRQKEMEMLRWKRGVM